MTTDPDRRARIEFDAAAYLIYAKEHTMSTKINENDPQLVAAANEQNAAYYAIINAGHQLSTAPRDMVDAYWAANDKRMALINEPTAHEAPDDPYLPHSFLENGQRMMRHDVGMHCECPDCTQDTCTDCGEPCDPPEDGDPYCEDCLLASIPEDVRAMAGIKLPWAITAGIALAALALSLTTHTAHAAIYEPTSPHNDCTDTGEITEFGGPILNCDGTLIYRDDDGQIYENDAGYPVYEPGTWVTLTYP
jgi:hypothetical protein